MNVADPCVSFLFNQVFTIPLTSDGQAWSADLVRTTPTTLYIERALQAAESVCGVQDFHNLYLSKADPMFLAQIQTELQRKLI
jgi:hypothetical protein